MKKYFQKITPSQEKLEEYKVLKPLAHWLGNPKIWHFNRRSIASGIAIGLFFGSFPIAGQMPLSAILAIVLRVNMPIAVVATWISNPFTMPFFYTANYYFGAWLLGRPALHLEHLDWSLDGMIHLGGEILVPLFFGSAVVGVILAVVSFIVIRLIWRLNVISQHKERKKRVT